MGYVVSKEAFDQVLQKLGEKYRLYAPVRKVGEGRFTDTDVVRYDFVKSLGDMELDAKSDYSFKEILTPLSQTLFFFTEGETKEADMDCSDVIVFLRACDLHAVKSLDDIYLRNKFEDPFYKKIREHIKFALIGCASSFDNCFCVDMGTNVAPEDYIFSIDAAGDQVKSKVVSDEVAEIFESISAKREDVTPSYVSENPVHVEIPDQIPNSVFKSDIWDEYSSRCIGCGRCDDVCPEYIKFSNIINKVNTAVTEEGR